MKYKSYILILFAVLICVYGFGKVLHINLSNVASLKSFFNTSQIKEKVEDVVKPVASEHSIEFLKSLVGVNGSQGGNYVAVISNFIINPIDRDSSYTIKAFAKILDENNELVDVGNINIGNMTMSADSNNHYEYSYPIVDGRAIHGDSLEVSIDGLNTASRGVRKVMLIPKEFYPSTMALPGSTVNRLSNYILNWQPDPSSSYPQVQIQVMYHKQLSKHYNASMPNSITDLVYRVPDNGSFTIPMWDLMRFPKDGYVTITITRGWLDSQSGNIAYVGLVQAITPPLLIVEPTYSYDYGIGSVEFSSNGLGGPPNTLCIHETDFDDYVNTFSVNFGVNPSYNGSVTLEYWFLDASTMQPVYYNTIPNIYSNQHYNLPPNMPEGTYYFEGRLIGTTGVEELLFEHEFQYAYCNASKSSFEVNVAPIPASNYFNVTITDTNKLKSKNENQKTTFTLFDTKSGTVIRTWVYADGARRRQLYIRGVKPGNYILVVTKDNHRQSKHVKIL